MDSEAAGVGMVAAEVAARRRVEGLRQLRAGLFTGADRREHPGRSAAGEGGRVGGRVQAFAQEHVQDRLLLRRCQPGSVLDAGLRIEQRVGRLLAQVAVADGFENLLQPPHGRSDQRGRARHCRRGRVARFGNSLVGCASCRHSAQRADDHQHGCGCAPGRSRQPLSLLLRTSPLCACPAVAGAAGRLCILALHPCPSPSGPARISVVHRQGWPSVPRDSSIACATSGAGLRRTERSAISELFLVITLINTRGRIRRSWLIRERPSESHP